MGGGKERGLYPVGVQTEERPRRCSGWRRRLVLRNVAHDQDCKSPCGDSTQNQVLPVPCVTTCLMVEDPDGDWIRRSLNPGDGGWVY